MIVNVTSVAGRVPTLAFQGFYGASKHGINALSEAMRRELEPFGIRVVCIEPGFFATEIVANADAVVSDADPYHAQHQWIVDFFEKSVAAQSGHPRVVADAIVAAATDPETPMHVLVGDDAVMFVDLVKQMGTYEAWRSVGDEIVAGVAGPRPV